MRKLLLTWPTEEDVTKIGKYVKRKEKKDISQLKKDSKQWIRTSWQNKLSYEITWLGIPVIQLPSDMLLMQELIFLFFVLHPEL